MTGASTRFDIRLERLRARLVPGLCVFLLVAVAHAQQPSRKEHTQPQAPRQDAGPRRIQAVRVNEAIKIDGLLNEPAWSLAQPATDFRQERPNESEPASERTEVRVLFDDKNIYFGIRSFACFDRAGNSASTVHRLAGEA